MTKNEKSELYMEEFIDRDNIPQSLDILGVPYEVIREDLDEDDGVIIPSKQVIKVDSKIHGASARQTFLHELLHGILAQLGYESDVYNDEKLVQGLAIGIHQALGNRLFVD